MNESSSVPTHPKLREDITFTPQVMRGEETFIAKDPVRRKFMQFDQFGKYFCELCDGKRSIQDIVNQLNEDNPESGIDEEFVRDYVEHLEKLKLVLKDRFDYNVLLMERQRQDRERNTSLLHMKFPAFNPDKLLIWLLERVRWMFSRPLKALYLTVVLSSFVIIVAHLPEVLDGLFHFVRFTGWSAINILILYVVIIMIIVLHEFGHGLTCKYYGGEVPAMGFLIIYLINPALYCNVSDSYLFPRKMDRIWVVFGGVVVELFIGALAVFIWWLTDPSLLIHDFAFKIVIFCSITSILFNMNPLLKYDGYYALSEMVEIPNLRKRSFAYLGHVMRKAFNLPRSKPAGGRREHRIFLIFGVAAICYAVMIFSIIFSLLQRWLVGSFAGLGWIMVLAVMYLLLRKVLRKSTGFIKLAIMDHSGIVRRNLPIVVTALIILLVVPGLIKVPTVIKGMAVLEPYSYVDLTASAPGYVTDLMVETGDRVERGQLVARVTSDSLEVALAVIQRQQNQLRGMAHQAYSQGDAESAYYYNSQLRRKEEDEKMLKQRRDDLQVRSPQGGTVLTPHLCDLRHQFVSEGRVLMRVGTVDSLRVRLEAPERKMSDLDIGTRAKFKPVSNPWSTAVGQVVAIDIIGNRVEEMVESFYRVETVVLNADSKLFPGQSGQIRLYGKKRSLWALLFRTTLQTLRLDFFI